ncbi:clonorporin 1 [Clonorchis sinensis]|uniref:Clonorporin 1 n=1 Tax=Clonorchis sinensis TaxID=79923 RepID=G7YCV4_CLOSI|nr:clonorporin 1 [Clonorchis sinensis]
MVGANSLSVELDPGRLVQLQRQEPVLWKVADVLLDGRSIENGEGDKESQTFQSHFDRLSLNEAGIISWNATDLDVVLPSEEIDLCKHCKTLVGRIQDCWQKGRAKSFVEKTLIFLCKLTGHSEEQCTEHTEEFMKHLDDWITGKTPEELCRVYAIPMHRHLRTGHLWTATPKLR